jgi:hypothetical protein
MLDVNWNMIMLSMRNDTYLINFLPLGTTICPVAWLVLVIVLSDNLHGLKICLQIYTFQAKSVILLSNMHETWKILYEINTGPKV